MNILTKTFIVLYLVASVALAVFVFMWMGSTQPIKDQMIQERTGRIAAQAAELKAKGDAAILQAKVESLTKDSQTSLATVKSERDDLQRNNTQLQTDLNDKTAALLEETNKVKTLTLTIAAQQDSIKVKDAELDQSRPLLATAIRQKAEMERALNEMTNQFDLAKKSIRALQEELQVLREKLAQAQQQNKAGTTGGAGAEAAQVATLASANAVKMNGKVTKVESLRDKLYVTLALGSRDGVAVGNRFVIYRDSQYVGDAVVERVTVDQSVAVVNPRNPAVAVQIGDLVTSNLGM